MTAFISDDEPVHEPSRHKCAVVSPLITSSPSANPANRVKSGLIQRNKPVDQKCIVTGLG